jgi:tetratricopeptide (TPR) repeat protein
MVSLLRGQGWVKGLSTPARDLPHRQRTLENVIDWSYTLLDDEQKEIFCKLGIFNGWFDADAASALCETSAQPFINSLTDHSLLVREILHGKPHWRMLELIHEYASSKLTHEVRSHVELLRVQHFLNRIQTLRQSAPRTVQEEYFQVNFSNYHHAIAWAIVAKHTDLCIQFIPILNDYWESLGYFKEGLDVVTRFLRSSAEIEPRTRAYLLDTASTLAWHQHDFETALVYAKEAIEQEHDSGREDEDPMHRNLLGRIYIEQGKFAEARVELEQCLALVQKSPHHLNPGSPLAQLGEVYLFEGRLAEARSTLEKSLTYLDRDDVIFIAMAKTDLA